MKSASIGLYRQLSFFLITLGGLVYLFFLVVFSQKIYSGFLMQFIYLFNSLVFRSGSFSSFVFRFDFIAELSIGILWLYLLARLVSGLFKVKKQIKNTYNYLNSLSIHPFSANQFVIDSPKAIVFTAGFLRPQVYISKKVIALSTPEELSSITNHELSHCQNYDPLKNLFIDFFSYIIPSFPGKSWFFGQYNTLVEISCDTFSQELASHPSSLISALIKVQESALSSHFSLSHFSAQSERINILVGRKKLSPSFILTSNFMLVAAFLLSTSLIHRTDFIYQCQHLVRCFQNLVIPDHLSPPANSVQNCDLPSISS